MNATLGMTEAEVAAFSKGLLESRGGRGGAGADRRMTLDQAIDNVDKLIQSSDIIREEQAKDKAAKKPIRDTQTIRDDLIAAELNRAGNYGGVAGTPKPGATPSAGAPWTRNYGPQ